MRAALTNLTLPVVVALVTLIFAYLKDLDSTARRVKRLEESKKRVEFWSLWLHEGEAFQKERDRAQIEIEKAAQVVEHLYSTVPSGFWSYEEYRNYRNSLPGWRKAGFFHALPTHGLKRRQTLLHLVAVECAISVALLMSSVLDRAWRRALIDVLVCLILLFVGSICWKYLSRALSDIDADSTSD